MRIIKNILAFLSMLPLLASCHFLEVEKTAHVQNPVFEKLKKLSYLS